MIPRGPSFSPRHRGSTIFEKVASAELPEESLTLYCDSGGSECSFESHCEKEYQGNSLQVEDRNFFRCSSEEELAADDSKYYDRDDASDDDDNDSRAAGHRIFIDHDEICYVEGTEHAEIHLEYVITKSLSLKEEITAAIDDASLAKACGSTYDDASNNSETFHPDTEMNRAEDIVPFNDQLVPCTNSNDYEVSGNKERGTMFNMSIDDVMQMNTDLSFGKISRQGWMPRCIPLNDRIQKQKFVLCANKIFMRLLTRAFEHTITWMQLSFRRGKHKILALSCRSSNAGLIDGIFRELMTCFAECFVEAFIFIAISIVLTMKKP